MRTVVLGLFCPTTDLVEELRRCTGGELLDYDAARLLRGEPLPASELAIVFLPHPELAVSVATTAASVTRTVAAGAWAALARSTLNALAGRRTLVVDTSSPDSAGLIGDTLDADLSHLPLPIPGSSTGDALAGGAEVYDAVRTIAGLHEPLRPPKLPPEGPAETAFAEEFLLAVDARDSEADLLNQALTAVASLRRRRAVDIPLPDAYAPRYGLDAAQDVSGYQAWLRNNSGKHERELETIARELARHDDPPRLAVVIPVYKPDIELLRACIDSVTSQSYERWELCLCDDSSDDPQLAEFLDHLERDGRIRVARRAENGGISAATNDAAALATADFLVFADQDDELAAGALSYVARAAIDHADADVIYTDEDKLDVDGSRLEPHFKPDWSPDLLLSQMYIGHLLAVRRQLFIDVGRLRSEYDGSQDFDLTLRATEAARRVVHIPRVAYHWRKLEGSSALDYRAKPYADVAARSAVADALRRRSEDAVVEDGLWEGTFRVRRSIADPPLVSIVIPFRDGAALLRKCITSIHATAGYERWEALLVDNRSWEPETVALTQQLGLDVKCRLLQYDNDFNWSAINNWAAEQASGDFLLFLNSDVEGSRVGWLNALVEHALRPEVGVVGARLLYPHGTVQHAGVVLGMGGGVAWHSFCHAPASAPGYFSQAVVTRNYSAVTGACMMIRRDVFDSVGGFDETLAVGFSDVDLCLQVRDRELAVIYTPFAELIHHESATRGRGEFEAVETVELFRRWGSKIRSDPYFNPNLDIHRSDFGIAPGAEEVDKWSHVLSLAEQSLSSSGTKSD